MGTLTTVPFETDNADASTDTPIPYIWLFGTTVPLFVIFGIITAALMFKHLRKMRGVVTTDASYTVSTHQNVRHIYDLCNESLHQENAVTDDDGYLAVVDEKDNE